MGKATATSGALFRRVVPNKNFITPDILGFYENGDYIMELSRGIGMSEQFIYGVTVVSKTYQEHDHELSQMFVSRKDAENYMNTGVLK